MTLGAQKLLLNNCFLEVLKKKLHLCPKYYLLTVLTALKSKVSFTALHSHSAFNVTPCFHTHMFTALHCTQVHNLTTGLKNTIYTYMKLEGILVQHPLRSVGGN